MNIKTRNTHSIIIGLATIFIVGLSLLPILILVLENFSEIQTRHGLFPVSIFYKFLWLGVTTAFGGYITSHVAATRAIFYSSVTGTFSFIIILGMGLLIKNNLSLIILLFAISPVFFCLIGGLMQKYTLYTKPQK